MVPGYVARHITLDNLVTFVNLKVEFIGTHFVVLMTLNSNVNSTGRVTCCSIVVSSISAHWVVSHPGLICKSDLHRLNILRKLLSHIKEGKVIAINDDF